MGHETAPLCNQSGNLDRAMVVPRATNKILQFFVLAFVLLAMLFGAGLMVNDFTPTGLQGRWAAAISSVPLLAVGLSFILAQRLMRPRPWGLLKNLLLAGTFVLWGIVQLMAQNRVSKILGDAVIVLYVADLAWTIFASAGATSHSDKVG